MKLIKSLALASFLISSASMAIPASSDTSIEVLSSEWLASFNSGKVEGMRGLYTDNAVMFPPSSEILESPAAITAYFDSLKQAGVDAYTISDVSLDVKGDVAYVSSLW